MAVVQEKLGRSSAGLHCGLLVSLVLVLMLGVASSTPTYGEHHLTKRSYFDINCKGLYDKSIFARLDRICQDCYSLYREPELHTLCRYDQ